MTDQTGTVPMNNRRGLIRLAIAAAVLWLGFAALDSEVISAIPAYFGEDDASFWIGDTYVGYHGGVPEDKRYACFKERFEKSADTGNCYEPWSFPHGNISHSKATDIVERFLWLAFGPLVGVAGLLAVASWVKKGFNETD